MNELQRVFNLVTQTLATLAPLFVDGAKLTFVMHVPGVPSADLVVGTGELQGAIDALKRSKQRSDIARTTMFQ